MGLPSKRRTTSSKHRRASHFATGPIVLVKCANCNAQVRPHHVCLKCGTYQGRVLIKISSKADKKLKKREKERKKEKESQPEPAS